MSLEGKTIIITGGSRGIGRALALRAAADGANVVIAAKTVDDSASRLKGTIGEVAGAVEALGGRALPLQIDVRSPERVAWMIDQAVETFGGIDVVVNNAGAIWLLPVEQLPPKRYDLMAEINLRAAYLVAHYAIPHLKRSTNGHILNLSPPVSLKPKWLAGHAPYTITKFGMTLLAIGLAEELRAAGVAANALWPRTTIATAAVEWLGGQALMKASRTCEIMADAFHAIVTSPAAECTGNAFLDEDLLRARGQRNFDRYRADPGTEPTLDFFVE